MSTPISHHYIPKSYQLLFSANGEQLFYFDKKKKDSKPIGPAGPKNFCTENHLYSLTGEAAKAADSPTLIENPLLSIIDGAFVNEVEKLLSKDPDKTNVNFDWLSIFLGILPVRHPSPITEYTNHVDCELKSKIPKHARLDDDMKNKAQELGLDIYNESLFAGISLSESRNVALRKMIEIAQENATFIQNSMGWLFLYSWNEDFLLCDKPFIMKDDPILIDDLLDEDGSYRILIPLSRQLCLALSSVESGPTSQYILPSQAKAINGLIMRNAERWVIGASAASLENILSLSS